MKPKARAMMWFVVTVVAYAVVLGLCLAVFVWSMFQVPAKTSTAAGSSILTTDSKNPCGEDNNPFKLHRPSHFTLGADPAMLGCGWSSQNSAIRALSCVLGVVGCGVSVFLTLVRRSRLTYLWALVFVAVSGGFFWATLSDGRSVNSSLGWCKKGLQGALFKPAGAAVKCNYLDFILICLLDAVAAVSALALGCFTLRYQWLKATFLSSSSSSDKGAAPTSTDEGSYAPPTTTEPSKARSTSATPLMEPSFPASQPSSQYDFEGSSKASGAATDKFDFTKV